MNAIKPILILVGGYILYEWLQSSGLWAQLTGGSATSSSTANPQQFTTASALLSYCQANPNLSAGIGNQNATCSQWLSAAGASASTTSGTSPSTTPATINTSNVDPTVAAAITALMQKQAGIANATISQWNWVWQNMYKNDPSAPVLEGSTAAEQSVGTQPITSSQYLALRTGAGLSGIRFAGMGFTVHQGGLSRVPTIRMVH